MDFKKLIALLVLALTMSGCATESGKWYADWRNCALAGVPVGAGVGLGLSGDGDDDPLNTAIGAAGGAVVGGVLCAMLGPDDVPPPVPDADGDGVEDSLDQCPDTPAGVEVDSKGCPLDSDGDGVPDYQDQCPDTPAGVAVNAQGCELDSDGDGVVDSKDQCPGTPPGTRVNELGCELAKPVVLEGVLFEFNSAKLKPESLPVLDGVADVLVEHPDLVITIVGHTDSVGSAGYNQKLSARRAQAVLDYLVSKGCSAANLSAEGRGESQPVADNSTEEGRRQNRRVELRTLDAQ